MLIDEISQVQLTNLALLLINIVCLVEDPTRFTICPVVRGIVLGFIFVRLAICDFHCLTVLVLVCILIHLMVVIQEIILATSLLSDLGTGVSSLPTRVLVLISSSLNLSKLVFTIEVLL